LLSRVRERMAYPLDLSATAAKSLILRMEVPLQGLADSVAAQLLSLDEAAAQLSLWVEDALQRHGREAILSTVLRRNLLLDGTILAFIDPLLRGKPIQTVDTHVLSRGRGTLIGLLIDIAQLDDDLPPAPEDDAADLDRLQWLDAAGLAHPELAALRAGLAGEGGSDAQTHFLMSSYLIFLQSFLMRAVVGMLGDLARGDAPWTPPQSHLSSDLEEDPYDH
jgi:hypothetical protein